MGINDERGTRNDERRTSGATIVRGLIQVDSRQYAVYRGGAELLDILGRRVMDLQPGANDVRRLSPGVYFVAEQRRVMKVVLQR